MYELVQISKNAYYVSCPSKIGIVKISDENVCLIDAGSGRDTAKKILKHIRENGWSLSAIYVTHSHADHIGGCKYLQDSTGCKIYARGIEADFVNHPILEPSLVWSANPPDSLRHKFLLAQPSICEPLTEAVLPECIKMIDLGGHSPEMVGFITDEGVAFIGDSFSGVSTLEKYRVGYIYDIERYLNTLSELKGLEAELYIPSHAEVSDNISEIVDYNIENTEQILEKITEICTQGATFEEILKKIMDFYALSLTYEQYGLVGSTVRAYITYLLKNGKIDGSFDCNMLRFIKK